MIKEIIAVLKDDVKDIAFRMDLGYISQEINDKKIIWNKYDDEQEITSRIIKPAAWN